MSARHGVVKDVDHGYAALRKRVFEFGHPEVATGILEADGAKQHETRVATGATKDTHTKIKVFGEDDKRVSTGRRTPHTKILVHTDDEVTIIQVADWMEFGTDDVPARSFVRAWFDEAEPRMREELRKLMIGVLKGTHTKEQILELLGVRAVGGIQKRIADGIDPPNKESTIKRKGSSKPLINSGQLRSSVSYAVRERSK